MIVLWLQIVGPVALGGLIGYLAKRGGVREADDRWHSALAIVGRRFGGDPVANAVLEAVFLASLSDFDMRSRQKKIDEYRRQAQANRRR